jgi:hypothetical protein
MEMTLSLQAIVDKWLSVLESSEVILKFCKDKYGKAPAFLAGANPRQSPDESYCPFILLLPGGKTEGAGVDEQEYKIGIAWVISQGNLKVDGVVKPFDDYPDATEIKAVGMEEADELGQIIYEVLQTCAIDAGYPISSIEYDISPQSTFPQFAGTMVATTRIEPALGETLTY